MFCPECAHNNPEGNRFCGMCGEPLPERTRRPARPGAPAAAGGNPHFDERREPMAENDVAPFAAALSPTREERRERIAEHDPEPVPASFRHREPIDEAVRDNGNQLPPAVADYYSSRLEPAAPAEETTVSGPSFLGLNDSGGTGSEFTYLYQEEQPKSHIGAIVFLLLLAVLAGLVYWRWEPIRNYVITAAAMHSKSDKPSAMEGAAQPSSTTASSDNAAPQPAQPADANGLPQQDNAATPGTPKTESPQPTIETAPADNAHPPEKKPAPDQASAPKQEQPQSEVGNSSRFRDSETNREKASAPKKPAARTESAPAQPAGAELVAAGEKYLYGRGAPQSCARAITSFNEAAKQRNPSAMAHLGALYATGQCVPMDRVRAYGWFSQALSADRGNTYIAHNLNMLWREMDAGERARATQRKLF